MEKLNILGTGFAMATKCYNTCFTISDGQEYFLVDAGGGNTILANLEKSNIPIGKIHNMFISHTHNDHILGAAWIIRAVAQGILNNKYEGDFNIYGHKDVIEAIKTISFLTLQKKFTKMFENRILFHEVVDGYETNILGRNIVFFDINSTKLLQYGFTTTLLNGKILTFLGDEPYRECVKKYCYKVDYLFHEAFCLYEDRQIFKPYEKHHATAKDACENARKLDVKNIILYHTEDKLLDKRKEAYTKEGQAVFNGNIYVPDDLEIINL